MMDTTAAVITVHRPNDMTKAGAKAVAKWMRKQADFLEDCHDELGPRFRARYLVAPRTRARQRFTSKRRK